MLTVQHYFPLSPLKGLVLIISVLKHGTNIFNNKTRLLLHISIFFLNIYYLLTFEKLKKTFDHWKFETKKYRQICTNITRL